MCNTYNGSEPEYNIIPVLNQIDPTMTLIKRRTNTLYDFMSMSTAIELDDIIIPSISDEDCRQAIRDLLNEEDINDTDIPRLVNLIEDYATNGKEWCDQNIGILIDNSISFNVRLSDISEKYRDFVTYLTTNPNVMKHIRGGKTWTSENINKFIEWCVLETKQDKKIRTNYFYVINEYLPGDLVQIGIVGIRQVNKQENKNKNPKYRNNSRPISQESMINYNLDIFISPEHHNHGSGTCAIRKCLEQYWAIYPNRTITINIPTDLTNMIHIVTKIGAVMEKTFTTGRAKFFKYIITPGTIIYPDDYLYLPSNERRAVIINRKSQRLNLTPFTPSGSLRSPAVARAAV